MRRLGIIAAVAVAFVAVAAGGLWVYLQRRGPCSRKQW
jgi:hypothetical protein